MMHSTEPLPCKSNQATGPIARQSDVIRFQSASIGLIELLEADFGHSSWQIGRCG